MNASECLKNPQRNDNRILITIIRLHRVNELISNEETFLQDFLVILQRMLQNH